MRKIHALFIAGLSSIAVNAAMAAVTIKKAAPVATQESATSSTTSSLVPSVLSLVSDVQVLNAKQRDLDTECTPSSAEIEFVNNTIKEWAKSGAVTANEVARQLNQTACDGGIGYEAAVRFQAGTDMNILCYDSFVGDANQGMVWYGFPKVSKATYCPDGSITCSDKEKKTATNIYDIFNLIDFGYADYDRKETTMAAKLLARVETCTDKKIGAKKKQMWGEFLVNAMGNVGQKTNTSAIMQSVGNITQSGASLNGGLSSLGAIASKFMDK